MMPKTETRKAKKDKRDYIKLKVLVEKRIRNICKFDT